MVDRGRGMPALTADEMREVDRIAAEEYGLGLLQMMENAGRNLAELARRLLGGSVLGKRLVVSAGRGNNGGGGLAAARHLHTWGAQVTVLLSSEELPEAPATQWAVLQRLSLERRVGEAALEELSNLRGAEEPPDLLIDALIGYGLSGPPRGRIARLIEAVSALDLPVLALDVPSGLDATTGEAYEPSIRAMATLTLALPKTGLLRPPARKAVGALYLADIGIPPEVYRSLGLEVGPLFAQDAVVALKPSI